MELASNILSVGIAGLIFTAAASCGSTDLNSAPASEDSSVHQRMLEWRDLVVAELGKGLEDATEFAAVDPCDRGNGPEFRNTFKSRVELNVINVSDAELRRLNSRFVDLKGDRIAMPWMEDTPQIRGDEAYSDLGFAEAGVDEYRVGLAVTHLNRSFTLSADSPCVSLEALDAPEELLDWLPDWRPSL